MGAFRRHLRRLNGARAIAVTSLLIALFAIQVLFGSALALRPLWGLAAAAYASILLYAGLDRALGDRPLAATIQVVGDMLLVTGFVLLTGGPFSPLSFLYALPVMTAAALLGLHGGLGAAFGAWTLYALMLADGVWHAPDRFELGKALYAAASHLLGFSALGALGGILADRLSTADQELARRDQDLGALRVRHADIVGSINSGVATTDRDGVIRFVNRAAEELLKQRGDQLVGRSINQLLELPHSVFKESEEALDHGRRPRFEREWVRPADGERLLLGMSLSVLRSAEADRQPDGWLVIFQDLTEISSLEEQVRVKERMAALGEMSAGMAHELRNPLAALSGCVQILALSGNDEHRRLSEIALAESERLNRIITDFLDFARPRPCRLKPLDLYPVMEEMVRMLRKSPDMREDHRVRVDCASAAAWALADVDRMRQVFWNLSTNALKAMPKGGSLTITLCGLAGDQLLISFKDDGRGMDPDTLKHYFQPFHSKFENGAGLGAAIVYRIAQEHGGQVQVVSREGRGTEIRVIIPAATSPRDVAVLAEV